MSGAVRHLRREESSVRADEVAGSVEHSDCARLVARMHKREMISRTVRVGSFNAAQAISICAGDRAGRASQQRPFSRLRARGAPWGRPPQGVWPRSLESGMESGEADIGSSV
jgi:hypothetical protein